MTETSYYSRRPEPLILTPDAATQRRREESRARRFVAAHSKGAHLPGSVARVPLVAIYDTTRTLIILGLLEEETR